MDKFEEAYDKLKKDGKVSVDGVVKWMKEAKLIESTKEAEDKARQLFADVKDKHVELEKFKEAISKLAAEQSKTLEDFTKMVVENGHHLLDAVRAGASAFKNAFSKK